MKTCRCPYCGTEANFVSAKPEELPSWPAGIPSKWPNATEHLIGGKACLRKRLTRSENRRQQMGGALADFRCAIIEDTYLPDEIRDSVLEHLDACFSPTQGEDHPPTDSNPNHDWFCHACGHWNGPNLAHCAMCPRPGSDLS